MIFSVRKKTKIATAAIVALGFSSLVFTVSPSFASAAACAQGGTAISDEVCQLKLTSGSGTFTPDDTMSSLKALVVGGGGASSYGYSGGGGQVELYGYTYPTNAIDYVVGGAGESSSVTLDSTLNESLPGVAADSSNGAGYSGTFKSSYNDFDNSIGAGGGSLGDAGDALSGGRGVNFNSITTSASPFYLSGYSVGGGGAPAYDTTVGTAVSGGGYVTIEAGAQVVVPPVANSGGGAAGATDFESNAGAAGVVVFRWFNEGVDTYQVSFNLDGKGTVDSQTIAEGDSGTQPEDPEWVGATFEGWYTDSDFVNEYDFTAAVTADTTVFAKWASVTPGSVTASFNLGGHGSVDAQTFTSGGTVTKPTDPTAEGFVFSGWFIDASFATTADFTSLISVDTTLFAKWETALEPTGGETTAPTPVITTTTAADELPHTGAEINAFAIPIGVLVPALGGGLIFWSTRRAALRRK